jgi:hypothetical protein
LFTEPDLDWMTNGGGPALKNEYQKKDVAARHGLTFQALQRVDSTTGVTVYAQHGNPQHGAANVATWADRVAESPPVKSERAGSVMPSVEYDDTDMEDYDEDETEWDDRTESEDWEQERRVRRAGVTDEDNEEYVPDDEDVDMDD